MSKDTLEDRLDNFVSRAFWPVKAFASVLEAAGKDTESFAAVDDIAMVCATLTRYAQDRIEEAVDLLQEHYGESRVHEERFSEKIVAVKRSDEK